MAGTKSVLVTGASRGLGAALARGFWEAKYSVLATARGADGLAGLAGRLEPGAANGQKVVTLPADIAAVGTAGRLADTVAKAFGRLDCLVCNAAIQGPIGSFAGLDFEAWREALEVDLVAQARLVHATLPLMREGGTILFLSGGGAAGPRPSFSAYATAKAGLVRFAETLAHELRDRAITVNCIAPGPMATAMLQAIQDAGAAAGAKELAAVAKVLDGDEDTTANAVRLALFLASERARGITGRLVSAMWDRYDAWPDHLDALQTSDAYTLRRIAGRERGLEWGDR